jgi:hypothetical protein
LWTATYIQNVALTLFLSNCVPWHGAESKLIISMSSTVLRRKSNDIRANLSYKSALHNIVFLRNQIDYSHLHRTANPQSAQWNCLVFNYNSPKPTFIIFFIKCKTYLNTSVAFMMFCINITLVLHYMKINHNWSTFKKLLHNDMQQLVLCRECCNKNHHKNWS